MAFRLASMMGGFDDSCIAFLHNAHAGSKTELWRWLGREIP